VRWRSSSVERERSVIATFDEILETFVISL
jgi:hypothetical protein